MKKIILFLTLIVSVSIFSQNQTWSGEKTFSSSLKFLNVPQNNLNTKLLSINSTTNKPEWVDKSSISSNTPGFQNVLNVDNTVFSFNGNPAFLINQGGNFSTQFSSEVILFSDGTANNNRQAFIGFDGFSSETDNGGKKVMLTTVDGLSLKTNITGFTGKINTNNITSNKTWQIENRQGQIAIENVTGTANLGIGKNTLNTANAGYNTAFGVEAMPLYTGITSTAVGSYSMYTSTGGTSNSAFGSQSMQNHTNGTRNTAIGAGCGYNLTTGANNTGLGYASLGGISVMTGSSNICLGFQAGRNITTGNNNLLIENITNASITTGSNNIILNPIQKSGVTTGSNNVIIGGYDGFFAPNLTSNIVLGTGNGITRLQIDANGKTQLMQMLNVVNVPIYIDNSTAITGGLVVGDVYKTSIGQLMIVY